MKIGYPCINTSLTSSSSRTFRLTSFSEVRFRETVEMNLLGLEEIIKFNIKHNLLFLRISSDLIPFASHAVNTLSWQSLYSEEFRKLGKMITDANMRISLHPDQFVLLNALNEYTYKNSVRELIYQNDILDLLGLNSSHKLQIHVGGVYGDKKESMIRFEKGFEYLPESIKNRLVIENDDRLYNLSDCLDIHDRTGVPILFDNLHHECLSSGQTIQEAFRLVKQTWKDKDGIPMVDYSEQEIVEGSRKGKHKMSLSEDTFRKYITDTKDFDFDIMLEIKDKELSALRAEKIIQEVR